MKKWAFAICCVLGLCFLLTGCGENTTINTNGELIYNGNSATLVGDYIYFGNGFSNDFTSTSDLTESDYNAAATVAYLTRLNRNIEQESKDYSPKNSQSVSSEVTAYANGFKFALGNDIYYTAPNKNRDSAGGYYFGNTTIYKSNLSAGNNGDKTLILNTEAAVSKIEALQYNGRFYIVLLAGNNLIRIDLSNNCSVSTLVSEVTSISIPKTYQKDIIGSSKDWNGQIFFTKAKNQNLSGNNMFKISIEGGEAFPVNAYGNGTYNFVGRENYYINGKLKDEVFYTVNSITYKFDANNDFSSTSDKFFEGEITNVSKVLTSQGNFLGYVFLNSSNKMGFISNYVGVKNGPIKFMDSDSEVSGYKVLAINGSQVLLLTSTKIYSADISQVLLGGSNEVKLYNIVTMEDIYDDNILYALDDKYVYYYAKLKAITSEEDSEDSDETEEPEEDLNYYLYRSSLGGSGEDNYELLGLTEIQSRRTK